MSFQEIIAIALALPELERRQLTGLLQASLDAQPLRSTYTYDPLNRCDSLKPTGIPQMRVNITYDTSGRGVEKPAKQPEIGPKDCDLPITVSKPD